MAAKEVVDYAAQNLAKGYSVEEIKAALLAGGWDEKEADEAIALAQKQAPAKPVPAAPGAPAAGAKKKSRKLVVVLVLLLVIAAIGAAVYLKLIDLNEVPVIRDLLATPTPAVEEIIVE